MIRQFKAKSPTHGETREMPSVSVVRTQYKNGFCAELREIDLSVVGAAADLLLEVRGGLLNR